MSVCFSRLILTVTKHTNPFYCIYGELSRRARECANLQQSHVRGLNATRSHPVRPCLALLITAKWEWRDAFLSFYSPIKIANELYNIACARRWCMNDTLPSNQNGMHTHSHQPPSANYIMLPKYNTAAKTYALCWCEITFSKSALPNQRIWN